MKNRIMLWLSALLIAALLTTGFALAEDPAPFETELEPDPIDTVILSEDVDLDDPIISEEAEVDLDAADPEAPAQFEMDFTDPAEAGVAPLMAPEGSIPIDEAHFPDPVLRDFIANKEMYIDDKEVYVKFGEDGYLSPEEINHFTDMDLRYANGTVASLKGIEYLPNIDRIICTNNDSITSVDVSAVTALVYIGCDFCTNLTSLTLGSLQKLRGVSIIGCSSLSSVNVSQCPTLLEGMYKGGLHEREGYWSDHGDITYYEWGWHNKEETHAIEYSANTEIITKATKPSTPSDDPTTPSGSSISTGFIGAGKKAKAKVSLTAAPGTTYTLDVASAGATKYKSSKKKVATVDAAGQVTIKGAGKTNITFKLNKKKRTLVLTVKDPTVPTGVTLSVSSTAVKKGDVVTLTPVIPEGTNTTFTWKSSNKKVATVKGGVVTFKKPGKVTITCTAKRGKKKARVKFVVSKQ